MLRIYESGDYFEGVELGYSSYRIHERSLRRTFARLNSSSMMTWTFCNRWRRCSKAKATSSWAHETAKRLCCE